MKFDWRRVFSKKYAFWISYGAREVIFWPKNAFFRSFRSYLRNPPKDFAYFQLYTVKICEEHDAHSRFSRKTFFGSLLGLGKLKMGHFLLKIVTFLFSKIFEKFFFSFESKFYGEQLFYWSSFTKIIIWLIKTWFFAKKSIFWVHFGHISEIRLRILLIFDYIL